METSKSFDQRKFVMNSLITCIVLLQVMVTFSAVAQSHCDEVTYYVLPTDPLPMVCNNNNSCLLGEICQTLNDYAKHSSHFFALNTMSNITLYFMCGLHEYTEQLSILNISTLIMQGMSAARNTIIQMPANDTSNQFSIVFSSVGTVRIRTSPCFIL